MYRSTKYLVKVKIETHNILVFISQDALQQEKYHIKITLKWAHEQLSQEYYIILFLTRHNESINDDKNYDLHILFPCLTHSVDALLMMSQLIADDVTMTRQLWCDISSDINFIHRDIHGQLCKKHSSHWLKRVIFGSNIQVSNEVKREKIANRISKVI